MIITEFLGLTGIAGEGKMTLGDSGAPEDASLGMYGALTKDPITRAQERINMLTSGASQSSSNYGATGGGAGGSTGQPPRNRPTSR